MKRKSNKSVLRLVMLFAVTAVMFAFAACTPKKAVEPVFTLDKTSIELTVDEKVETLELTVANVDDPIVWESNKPDVAQVTVGTTPNKATVKGISAGTATIIVKAGSLVQVCAVTVKAGVQLELLTTELNLLVGRDGKINADVTPATTAITYESSNASVATVSANGTVTGISAGVAYITVKAGNRTDVCTVYVTAPSVTITDPANEDAIIQLLLEEDFDTYQLVADSNGTVEWFTGDDTVATVSETGLLTAVAEGETTVTAKFGSAEDFRVVKVKADIISVALDETEKTILANESFTLTATVTSHSGNLEDESVIWEVVKGKNIVSVDENGLVTSLGEIYGTATVRATSNQDPDSWAECEVTVPDPFADWITIETKQDVIDAFKAGNEDKNMRLMGDIDMEGAELNSGINQYRGTFNGNGYEIMNYSGKLFHNLSGTVQNTIFTFTTNEQDAGICHHLNGDGVIKNCVIDVTFGAAGSAGIGCFVQGKAENVVIIAHNSNNVGNSFAATVQGTMGNSSNVFYAVYGGNVNAGGATLKTDAQLRTAATFEGWDTDIWQIEDGELPTLKNDGNIGELTLTINETQKTLRISEQLELIATVKPAKLPSADRAVTWTSSNEDVATVVNGLVTAVGDGTAVITCTSVKEPSKSVTCTITVNNGIVAEITLTSPENVSVELGETAKIEATVTIGELTYTSSDENVARVDENGNVTAVSAGTATIRIQATDSEGVFKDVTVTVNPAPEVSITNKDATASPLKVGDSLTLTATANRDDGNLEWTSSDTAVATVDTNGKVTAKAVGKTTITVNYTANGITVSDTVVVTVYDGAYVEFTYEARSVAKGETWEIAHSAAGGTITWTSSNPEFATVNNGVVTAVAVGKTTITATVAGKSQTMVIQVYNKEAGYIEVSTVEQFLAITGANKYYLVNDIDFAGKEYKENTFQTVVATIRGNGYAIKNLTINLEGVDVGFIDQMGNGFDMQGVNFINMTIKGTAVHGGFVKLMVGNAKIANCYFQTNIEARGIRIGVIGMMDGSPTLSNCIFETTFRGDGALGAAANANPRAAVGRKYNGKVENVFVNQTALGDAQGKVFAVSSGDGNSEQLATAFKTEEQLKTESLYDGSWEEYWITVDGELPVLKGALVTEPLKVKLDKTSGELFVGGDITLTATVTPAELPAEDKEVVWTSSNTTIATVDANGKVTALKAGTVTITATSAKENGKSASCVLTIKAIELSITEGITELKLGGTHQLGCDVNSGDVTWSSSDNTVATVVNGLVTALKAGTVTITATSTIDASVKATVTIEVKSSVEITVELPETLTIAKDETATLKVTVTNSNEGVTWASSDETVATVDQNGKVTAVGEGTATITATAKDDGGTGNYAHAECTVTVFIPKVKMAINVQRRSLHVGGSGEAWSLEVTLDPIPDSPSADDVVWTSSNPSAVTVTGEYADGVYYGRLTTVAAGKAVITATRTIDGDAYTITCEIDSFVAQGAWNAIATPAQFKNLNNGTWYYLANDLDFTGIEITENYVSQSPWVAGKLDGRGYSIMNVTTKFNKGEQGLIGMLDGATVIENVNFVNFELGADENIIYGGIIYNVNGGSIIRNCYFQGVITAKGNPNEAFFGAIGVQWNSNIEYCVFNVTVSDDAKKANANATPRAMIGRWIMGTTTNCVALAQDYPMHAAPGDGGGASDRYPEAFKSEAEFKSAATYDGWDTSVWVIEDGEYPRLRTAWDD